EGAVSPAGARDFLRAVSNMVALRMTAGTEAPIARAAAAAPAPTTAIAGGRRSFTAELVGRPIDPKAIEAGGFQDVAVMGLHLTDPVAMAMRAASGTGPLSDRIACALQEIAATHNIPYLKIVGQEVVGAAGIDAAANGASAQIIADAAVAVRDRCLALLEDSDRPQEFRIGIDCGPPIRTAVGSEPRVFNLWGEAGRTAHALGAPPPPGTAQATPTAHRPARQR